MQGLPGGTEECGARPRGRAGTRVVEAGRARKGREAVPFWAGKREEGVNLGRVGRGGCWARVRGKVGGLGCWFWAGEKEREWPDGDWVGFSHGLVSSFGFSFYFSFSISNSD